MIGIAFLSLVVIYGAVYIESGFTFAFERIIPFIFSILVTLVAFRLGNAQPARTLYLFSLIVIVLIVAAMLLSGITSIWIVISIGLFISIMWSNIFTLAIADLGQYTAQGSALLMMSVLGGALVPFAQGLLADVLGGYHYSFFIPLICYVYLMYYGLKGHKVVVSK